MNTCKQCNEKKAAKMFCSKKCRNKFYAGKPSENEDGLTQLRNKFLLGKF